MKNLLYIILTAMLPATLQAQTGDTYQGAVADYRGQVVTAGSAPPIVTYYLLRFTADSAGICVHTIATATDSTLAFNNWQYFKWKTENNKILITGLPPSYQKWDTLQVLPNANPYFATIENEHATFYKQERFATTEPTRAIDTVIGKSYAVNIGGNSYLALTFDENTVELISWKNIDPKVKVLAYDGTQKTEKYSWIRHGQRIFIPGFEQSPMLTFVLHQLCIRHNGNFYMAKEVPYRQPIVCYPIEAMLVKKQRKRKGENQPPTPIRLVYGPKKTKGFTPLKLINHPISYVTQHATGPNGQQIPNGSYRHIGQIKNIMPK